MSRALPIAFAAICLVHSPASAQEQIAAIRSVVADGSGSIIIASSESGKTLYGYSAVTGTWEGLAVVNPAQSRLNPIVGSALGYVVIDKKIHVYSGATGHWATLEVPEVVEPKMFGSRMRVDIGTKIHMFSAVTGKWATVDLTVDMK